MDGIRRALSPTEVSVLRTQSAVQPDPDKASPCPARFVPAIADLKTAGSNVRPPAPAFVPALAAEAEAFYAPPPAGSSLQLAASPGQAAPLQSRFAAPALPRSHAILAQTQPPAHPRA